MEPQRRPNRQYPVQSKLIARMTYPLQGTLGILRVFVVLKFFSFFCLFYFKEKEVFWIFGFKVICLIVCY